MPIHPLSNAQAHLQAETGRRTPLTGRASLYAG